MSRVLVKLVVLIITVAIGTTSIHAQQKRVWLVGQAIDDHGKPLSNAVATLYYPPCRGCLDHILRTDTSRADGLFIIEATGLSRGLKLYIEENIPNGSWSPFGAPPYSDLPRLPLFASIPIQPPRKGKGIDLGRVVVKLRYGKVKLELPDLLREHFKPDRGDRLKLTLRDHLERAIYDGYLPDVAVDPASSSVTLALPQGKWFVNFSLGDGPQRVNSPQILIAVDKALNAIVIHKRSNKDGALRKSS